MQAIDQKILSRIYGRGRGWAFTKIDFVAGFGEANIHQALSGLARAGKIRRVCHGVYDYPRYSDLLALKVLEADYRAMSHMIFGRIPSFSDIVAQLRALEAEINGSSYPECPCPCL